MMRVLILANGESPSLQFAQRLAAEHDLLIATDGAAHRAAGLGLTPGIVCGDFDSVRLDVAHAEFPQAEFVPTPDQDWNDLEKALHLARERGATTITITGATGGRVDQTLATMAILLGYHGQIPIRLVEDHATVQVVAGTEAAPGRLEFAAEPGDTLSLLSFDGKARVTLTGVRWPLQEEVLPVGTHGVSNVVAADRVFVQARGGTLLVCHLPVSRLPA